MIFRLLRMLFPNSKTSFLLWCLSFGGIAYTFTTHDFRKEVIAGDVIAVGLYLVAWVHADRE